LAGLKFELIRWRVAGACVEPVHETGSLIPAGPRRRFVGAAGVLRDAEQTFGVSLHDHLLGDLKLADTIGLGHRSDRVWIAGYVRRIAGIRDRNPVDIEYISPAAKPAGPDAVSKASQDKHC
jgi:hypothetical protein